MDYVTIGRGFEWTIAKILSSYRFCLSVTGKAGDGGIDLRGTWNLLPSLSSSFHSLSHSNAEKGETTIFIVGQVKHSSNKMSVSTLREFTASLYKEQKSQPRTLGLLAAKLELSAYGWADFRASPFPLAFALVQPRLISSSSLQLSQQEEVIKKDENTAKINDIGTSKDVIQEKLVRFVLNNAALNGLCKGVIITEKRSVLGDELVILHNGKDLKIENPLIP